MITDHVADVACSEFEAFIVPFPCHSTSSSAPQSTRTSVSTHEKQQIRLGSCTGSAVE